MATLWRGIVGPDITIAVVPTLPIPPPISAGSSNSDGKSIGGIKSSSGGGGVSGGAAEVRLDEARAIVVREDGKGEVVEGVLRRVGFEVGEWVRNKDEGRRNS